MRYIYLITVFLLAVFIVSCGDDNPVETDDPDPNVLQTSSPEEQGMDSGKLDSAEIEIFNRNYGIVNSFIVFRNGFIVKEAYFRGYTKDSLHSLFSVSKSINSAVFGIAVDEGLITNLDAPLYPVFTEYDSFENDTALKADITIKHALTMSTGLEWSEVPDSGIFLQSGLLPLINSNDYVKYYLDRPLVNSPGTQFNYSSGSSITLSGVIGKAAGMNAAAYGDAKLFAPMGITNYEWALVPANTANGGWGVRMRTRDMIKIGWLFLNKGNWNGEQLISESWVNASTSRQIYAYGDEYYGYQWWMYDDDHSYAQVLAQNDMFFASGFGGQNIVVIPHLNLVIAITQENLFDGRAQTFAIINDWVLPAVEDL